MSWQLLREWPPGYGGVERVAHQIACIWHEPVFSLVAKRSARKLPDPLAVFYPRVDLARVRLGRLLFALPTLALCRLLASTEPLHVHLPCPGVLALTVLARLIRPRRRISLHWHAFLDSRGFLGGPLLALYQAAAMQVARRLDLVITTSPVLLEALRHAGVPNSRLALLPCALTAEVEEQASHFWEHRNARLQLASNRLPPALTGRLIVIGRLGTYKRIDWLLRAMAEAPAVQELHVVGDGSSRHQLQRLAARLSLPHQRVLFHGRLGETAKQQLLSQMDVLVLPSDRCNEAFGLVQLEAMACGVPALAYCLPRSGMHWVSALPALPWSGAPADLAALLQRLLTDPVLHARACIEARQRYEEEFALTVWHRHWAHLASVGVANG